MVDIFAGEKPHDRHAGVLAISVLKDWRGRGVGRLLMDGGVAEARKWPDFCRIELLCTPWNEPAIALYKSLGFVTKAVKRKAIDLRGRPEDELLMALVW